MKSGKRSDAPEEQKERGGQHLADQEGHVRKEDVEKMGMVQTKATATGYWDTVELLEPEQRVVESEVMTPFERQFIQRCRKRGMVDRETKEWLKEF